MFHIDFPFNWGRKINWHTQYIRTKKTTRRITNKTNREQPLSLMLSFFFCFVSVMDLQKRGERTSIEWIWNKSQFIYMLTNIWTRTKAISKWTFPHEQSTNVRAPCVLLMDKVRKWCCVLLIVSGFCKINKILPTNYGPTFAHNSLHWSSFSICSCLFISLYLNTPLHWEWLILITLWNTFDDIKKKNVPQARYKIAQLLFWVLGKFKMNTHIHTQKSSK